MGLRSAIKAAIAWASFGGQGLARGGIADWLVWHGGTDYDHVAAAGELYQNGVVMACVSFIMRAFPEPPIQVIREEPDTGEENKVPRHPLTRAFQRPNPFYGADCLWQRIIYDRSIHGQAFLYKERNGRGDVLNLWHVPQHRIIPQWDTSGRQFISHYLFVLDQQQQRIPIEDIVHLRFGADPRNERNGLPVLGAGLREIAALNEGANYRGAILKNMGVPSHIVQSKDPMKVITAEQAQKLQALWLERVSGGNRGRPIIPSWALEAIKIGLSPEELDIGTMNYEAADLICSLFGLSAQVVGLSSGSEHKTYANYAESREAATESALVPAWKQIAQDLTLHLLPDYSRDEQERVEFDLSKVRGLQEDQDKLWTRVDTAVTSGIITINEGRALLDFPPVDGGDVFLLKQGEAVKSLKDAAEKPEPPAAPPGFDPQAPQPGQAPAPSEATNGNGREPVGTGSNGRA